MQKTVGKSKNLVKTLTNIKLKTIIKLREVNIMEKEQIILSLDVIKPYEKNARKNDDAVPAVMESIRQCGYVQNIVVDENNVILAGHTRWKALKKLSIEMPEYQEIKVTQVTGLTDEQKRKYRLLDNKTSELALWDYDLLPEELDGLDFGDL